MAAAKKKIQASEVVVGNRTLESVLIDLAEQVKANDARFAARTERAEAWSAQIEARSARAEELSAEAEVRSARAEEMAAIALHTIAAVSQDLRAITADFRANNKQFDERIRALENAAAAE